MRSSGFIGVHGPTKAGNYQVIIACKNKRLFLGTYASPEYAAAVYDWYSKKFKKKGRTNFNTGLIDFALKTKPKKSLDHRNITGYKGVYLTEELRFKSTIGYGKKVLCLGTFGDAVSAALAYDTKAKELGRVTNEEMGLL